MIVARPACDLEAALRSLEGDSDLLNEMALIFLEESVKMKAAIHEGVESGDANALMRSAHNIKGSVANFAAEGARSAAHQLEMIGRSGDLIEVPAKYEAFLKEIEVVEAELRRYVKVLPALE